MDTVEISHDKVEPFTDGRGEFRLRDWNKTETAIKCDEFGLGVHVEGLVPAALLDQEDHHGSGKTPETIFFENIYRINLEPVFVTGAAGYTNDPLPGKDGKEAVALPVGFLLVVMDPEFFLSTLHLGGRKFADFNGLEYRARCGGYPVREDILPYPADDAGPQVGEPPALLSGKGIKRKEREVFVVPVTLRGCRYGWHGIHCREMEGFPACCSYPLLLNPDNGDGREVFVVIPMAD
jgi:hypothetical protein